MTLPPPPDRDRWDAAHAAGTGWAMDTDVAVDAVEEFLTCSVADAEDAASRPTLGGTLTLTAEEVGRAWQVHQADDGELLRQHADPAGPVTVRAGAADLLLWPYHRVELPVAAADEPLVAAFRRLSATD